MDQGNDEIFKLCKLSEVSNSQGVSHSIPVLLGPSLFNADGRDGAYYEYSFRQLDCHDDVTYKDECLSLFPLGITLGTTQTFPCLAQLVVFQSHEFIVGPLPRVRPRNGILALLVGEPLRSEFIGEL